VSGVSKRFGTNRVLEDVDLAIEAGGFITLLGPSGCGKTTLLRIIAGLETQTAGRILQAGRDISVLPPAQRDYGIVFQSYALFPNLSIADNVAYGLVNRRQPRAQIARRVDELLTLVGLPGSGPKFPAQLSGGQQQRIALARALATEPGLLLLDEPLSALDAIVRVHLRAEIRSLQRKLGVTTIMVTHDQEEALSVADRIVVMNQGAIEQVGTPQDIYERPATAFVAEFVGKVNVLPARALGHGRFRVGRLDLQGAAHCDGHVEGAAVHVYLRPEDRIAEGALEGVANRVWGEVSHVEFLGGSCLAQMRIDELDGQPLLVSFSLNQMHDLGVRVGARLEMALRSDRLRVF